MDTEDIDGTVVDNAESSEFKNTAGDKIEVKVGIKETMKKIQSINPANAKQKTIAGKEGYLIKGTDDGKNEFKFEYLQDSKIVKITAAMKIVSIVLLHNSIHIELTLISTHFFKILILYNFFSITAKTLSFTT